MAEKDKVFLLRPSTTAPGCIVLSLVNSDVQLLYHFLIAQVFDGYQLQECPFDDMIYHSIQELIVTTPLLHGYNPIGRIRHDHTH
jgi:hypothetical protein